MRDMFRYARYVFIANKKRAHAQSFIAFPRLPYQLISILQEVNIKTMLKIALLLAAVPILQGSASCKFGDDYPSNPVGDITAYQEEPYSGNCNLDLKALKARSKGWTHFAALPKSTHYKGGKIQNSYSRYILVTAPPCHSQLSKLRWTNAKLKVLALSWAQQDGSKAMSEFQVRLSVRKNPDCF